VSPKIEKNEPTATPKYGDKKKESSDREKVSPEQRLGKFKKEKQSRVKQAKNVGWGLQKQGGESIANIKKTGERKVRPDERRKKGPEGQSRNGDFREGNERSLYVCNAQET